MKTSELPAPRLQIEWERVPGEGWIAWYELILPVDKMDVRATDRPKTRTEDGGGGWYDGICLRLRMGATRRSGGGMDPVGPRNTIDTPFRDGSHILWDAERLKLPAFAVWGERASDVIAEMAILKAEREFDAFPKPGSAP